MRMLKHASNDIKSEVTKSAHKHGIDTSDFTKNFKEEVDKVKDEVEDAMGSVKREL